MGGVRDYEVSGELTYVELASGGEYIADGTTYNIENLHTDAIDGADDMNIVGVRLTMTYGETMKQCRSWLSLVPKCSRHISGTQIMLASLEVLQVKTGGQGGSHFAEAIWYNDSMMGVISGLSEAEIVAQIDAMGAGLGPYNASVSVTAETVAAIACCNRTTTAKTVSYTVELIVFDYTIAPFIELTDV